ncbi:MAG: 5-formyltetrahydrofolate cyclo-ligase [Oscillospiraceae bacterium]|nr:5-formyltetrahydrofolate cyclo-ligase [Oscillospiraceae bacterium]
MVKGVKTDIREHKNKLREKYKQLRRDMPGDVKRERDEKILSRLLSLSAYKSCDTVLTYVSTAIEVDTVGFIEQALQDGKRVAVPKCVKGTRDMKFYVIKSLDDLEPGYFSVLEPVPKRCTVLKKPGSAFCVIPALAYDRAGYRLGYGKGYYDRFLSANKELVKVGIEYCCCMETELLHGKFDVPADIVVTEKYVKKCRKEQDFNGAKRK